MASAVSVVSDAVKSLHSRFWKSAPPFENKTKPKTSCLESFDALRLYIERYDIDPNPANYSLLYRHYVRGEANLAAHVTRLIETGYAPDPHDMEDGDKNGLSEEDLQVIANSAQEQLKALEALANRSHDDARGFGDALEGRAEVMAGGGAGESVISALIDLTRVMIVKTRAAEQELRIRGETMADLQASLADARSKANTDSLTGLSNRRAFERMLGAVSERAQHSGRPVSLAICDVDHFKSINDRFGHITGDRVLTLIGAILTDHCGKRGHVFRLGGEEYAILFEEVDVDSAYELVDAARRDLADRHIVKKETGEALGKITFSAGIGALPPALDASGLLRIADRALYAAKANGRNCAITVVRRKVNGQEAD